MTVLVESIHSWMERNRQVKREGGTTQHSRAIYTEVGCDEVHRAAGDGYEKKNNNNVCVQRESEPRGIIVDMLLARITT